MKNYFPKLFKKESLLLILIILIGAYLRFPGIFGNYFAFTYDVGRDMLALWDLAYGSHKLLLIGFTTGLPGVFYGPWWYYLLLLPYTIVLGNPQGLALVMAFIGILTIVLGYFLGNKINGKFLGLSFASLISVSPVLVSLSTQIWNPFIAPIFIVLALWVIHKMYLEEKPKSRYFFLLGLLMALIIDLEIVFGVLLLVGLILSLLIIKKRKFQLKSVLLFLIGAVIIFSPRIIFELRHNFLMTNSLVKFLVEGDGSSAAGGSLINLFINRAQLIFDQFNATLALDNKLLGASIILIICVSLYMFYKKATKIYQQFIITSVIVLLTFLIGLTLFKHDIWPHYVVGLPVFYIFIFCLSLGLLSQNTKTSKIPLVIVIIVFLINLNPIRQVNNLNKPIWVGDASVYKNQLEVVDYVYKQAKGKEFKYVVYTPPLHDYTYRYLFKWYGPGKYGYQPNDNPYLAYFILEPDMQYPFRLTDWLKFREKDGQIVKTERFKSGIIVQTRVNK